MLPKSKHNLNLTNAQPKQTVAAEAAPGEPGRKPMLNLRGDGSTKLARAFQKLVGSSTTPPLNNAARRFLNTLTEVGFSLNPQGRILSHPTAPALTLAFPYLSELQSDTPELAALQFAISNLPELGFYLPYITTRAKILGAGRSNQSGGLPPEPEYDEDGFLSDEY